ncbi:hypothetical protein F511_08667 [Dorcoceras hygrometricum]|uniref:Uncharacterized protein n=1 Tax=Dorcoceras hygrometricum TaxID=472368 RepID=A0A2Z7AB68_9LAMI|nr:hypothetical protein F511_08667 [Dorcoceras hygrometricum]
MLLLILIEGLKNRYNFTPEIKTYVVRRKPTLFVTLIFVFAGSGSGIAYNKLTHDGPSSAPGLISVAIAHDYALFVAVSVAANISGGHVNPAVTFGLFVGGNISLVRGILYIIAQLLGSTAACSPLHNRW